ncbi:hypothetical protein [Streptomyces sp. NPDC047841]|uniref:hypothetical protein n=1 Tax=Streptomyces sp. NPDC047841 TaxID=3154708 RepID=UPI003455A20B
MPGEPAEAVQLRQGDGRHGDRGRLDPVRARSQRAADRARHRFAPQASPAAAYDGGDRAVITRRDETGTAISNVSAARLRADMIESLRHRPGSGGYDAELITHVAGPHGRVVTVDIGPWVVRRTRAFLTEAGSGHVTAVEPDAALGAPAQLVPRGGFDGSLITYSC